MTITIRPIAVTDKERWLDLFKQYIVFYKSSLTDEQFELSWQRIHSDFNINGLVAELDGHFRPSTWDKNDYCYLEDLFVDPTVRGNGVGRALIDALHKIAIERGSKRLYWTTAVDNETARKLYDKVATTEQIQYRILI